MNMSWRKKGEAKKPPDSSGGGVMVYPDGSISVDPRAISRQYREQFRASARSNLEEEEWREILEK